MSNETIAQRTERILTALKGKYPDKKVFDLDDRGLHFVCEVEPTTNHPDYDVAVEVIIDSIPHKHLKMTQYYKILSGSLALYIEEDEVLLPEGDTYTIQPNTVHSAKSVDGECWVEIRSEPGWTKEDHIIV